MMYGRLTIGLICSVLCYLEGAHAQAQAPAQTQTAGTELDEVVVTARKRVENVLDTPVAVTVLTADAIAARNITDLQDVADFAPGLKFDNVGNQRADRSNQTLIIRGMSPNFNGNVSVFIDGAPVVANGYVSGLEDLERVEVVKGPQSATFGRATFAGAVNLVTKDPSNDFHASIDESVSTYSGYDVKLAVEGPIIADKVTFRIQARDYSTAGDYKNGADLDESLGAQKTQSVNATLKITPNDRLSMKIFGDYWIDDDGSAANYKLDSLDYNCAAGAAGPAFNYTCGALPGANLGRLGVSDQLDAAINNVLLHNSTGTLEFMPGMRSDFTDHYGLERRAYHVHGIIDYDLPEIDATITSTTAYDQNRYEVLADLTDENTNSLPNPLYSPAAYGSLQAIENFPSYDQTSLNGFSEDIRLQGGAHGAFHWNVGASYVLENNGFVVGALLDFGPVVFQAPTNTKTVNTGGFFSIGYDLTKQLTVSFDGRYENERQYVYDLSTGTPVGQANESFDAFLPRALIQYRPLDKMMLYFSYSQGINPGGFNTNLIGYAPATQALISSEYDANLRIQPEKIRNYELGVKAEFLGGRAQLAADVYHDIWTDQVVGNDVVPTDIPGIPPGTLLGINQNIGQTDFTGVELEGSVVPIKGLTVNGGFAYTPSKIEQYDCTTCALSVTGNPDVDGHHLGGAPALSGNFGVEYKRPVMAGVDGYGRVDVIYEGRIYEDETNLAWIPANSKVNLRLGAQYGVMTFEGYVTNLFDDLSYTDAQRAVDVLRNYTNTVSAGLPVRRTLGFRFRAAL